MKMSTGSHEAPVGECAQASAAMCRTSAMSRGRTRLILIDSSEGRHALADRLAMQGYTVDVAAEAAEGAKFALERACAVVVADLWMPSISGVQLCRLLKSEPSTAHVPVILRGSWGHRDRFWAERAGAGAYVAKGRVGDLMRAIQVSIERSMLGNTRPVAASRSADLDVRDRIAELLDQALFDSVIASEVRSLSVLGDFERLFDRFSQLVTQITSYRWLALLTEAPARFAVHAHPNLRAVAEREATAAAGVARPPTLRIEDEDPFAESEGPPAIVEPIWFGTEIIGKLAIACRAPAHPGDRVLASALARELGAPLRIVTLVEESQRQTRIDALTSLLNRRALLPLLDAEIHRARRYKSPLALMLIDVDHFKQVNDRYGHGIGDQVLAAIGQVLAAIGRTLTSTLRTCDLIARWGGEEFVAVLPSTDLDGARLAGERLREAVQGLTIKTIAGAVPVTISLGVALYGGDETDDAFVDRADRAMYLAKTSGRNRVEIASVALPWPKPLR